MNSQNARPAGRCRLSTERKTVAVLGITARQLAQEREAGRGPPYFQLGSRRYYDLQSALDWLETRCVDPIKKESDRVGSRVADQPSTHA